ncbi:hypothetical protein [Insolitispirillum peregrinum]|uniref:hypothetical protein n=1 Tax=Insolitispirillum peregrinum TaxID=80876 RepID=UPI0036084BA1
MNTQTDSTPAPASSSPAPIPTWVPPLDTVTAMTVTEFTAGRITPGDDGSGTDTLS